MSVHLFAAQACSATIASYDWHWGFGFQTILFKFRLCQCCIDTRLSVSIISHTTRFVVVLSVQPILPKFKSQSQVESESGQPHAPHAFNHYESYLSA